MANKSAEKNSDVEGESRSLSSIFEEGLALYNNLGKIDEPTNSYTVQSNVRKAIRIFEEATRLVSLAGVFSTNESIDEIPTEDLRYMLLPSLLGSLCLKLTSGERKEIAEVAEIYFNDYLQRCNDYGLSNYEFPNSNANEVEKKDSQPSQLKNLEYFVNMRASKIQRFREQKELRVKIMDLKNIMENENVDEQQKRNYYMTTIKLSIYEAVDDLNSIDAEKEILAHIALYGKEEKPRVKGPKPAPLKPVIITKDAVQKAVFGAGYPSLPVMSVEEFYEKRVREGIFPDPQAKKGGPVCLQEATSADIQNRDEAHEEQIEKHVENDDPQYLEEMRRKDDFKDDHRRGWGNRMNRS